MDQNNLNQEEEIVVGVLVLWAIPEEDGEFDIMDFIIPIAQIPPPGVASPEMCRSV